MTAIFDDEPGFWEWAPAYRRGRGRPPFQYTPEKAKQIMGLFGSGYSQAVAARVLGCDVKALRKVFALECQYQAEAALIIRSKMMVSLMDQAEAGNVAAIKALDKMLDAERARATDARMRPSEPRAAKKAAPKGKKEEQQDAAQGVGGLFGTRKPPPSALIN